MKKALRIMLAMILCLAVSFTVFSLNTENAYAATTVSNGTTITATDINASNQAEYRTPMASKYTKFSYNIKVPKAGTVYIISDTPAHARSYFGVTGIGAKYARETTVGANNCEAFTVTSAGIAGLTITVSPDSGYTSDVVFKVLYAQASGKTVKLLNKKKNLFALGSTGYDFTSSFKVVAPSKGYLQLSVADGLSSYTYIEVKTSGFKTTERINSSRPTTYIGLKKGTYTITLKGAYEYDVSAKFVTVKESSTKTTKLRAAKIKRKKLQKGLLVTNDKAKKKVRWYKIKNPKKQKLRIYVNGSKLGAGNNSIYSGYLKLTVYFPDGSSKYTNLYPGQSGPLDIKYDTFGSKKARKGTYKIKVQSVGGCNGYYTLKWK